MQSEYDKASKDNDAIEFFLKDWTGKTHTFKLPPRTTVDEFMSYLWCKDGITCTLDMRMRVIFAGMQLESRKTLHDHKVRKESTLHLTGTLCGGGQPKGKQKSKAKSPKVNAGKVALRKLSKFKNAASAGNQTEAQLKWTNLIEVFGKNGFDEETLLSMFEQVQELNDKAVGIKVKPKGGTDLCRDVDLLFQKVATRAASSGTEIIVALKGQVDLTGLHSEAIWAMAKRFDESSAQTAMTARYLRGIVLFRWKQDSPNLSNKAMAKTVGMSPNEVDKALKLERLVRKMPLLLDYSLTDKGMDWLATSHVELVLGFARASLEVQHALQQPNRLVIVPGPTALALPAPPAPAPVLGLPPALPAAAAAAGGGSSAYNFDAMGSALSEIESPSITIRTGEHELVIPWITTRTLRASLNAVQDGNAIIRGFRLQIHGKDLDLDTPMGKLCPAGTVITPIARQRGGGDGADHNDDATLQMSVAATMNKVMNATDEEEIGTDPITQDTAFKNDSIVTVCGHVFSGAGWDALMNSDNPSCPFKCTVQLTVYMKNGKFVGQQAVAAGGGDVGAAAAAGGGDGYAVPGFGSVLHSVATGLTTEMQQLFPEATVTLNGAAVPISSGGGGGAAAWNGFSGVPILDVPSDYSDDLSDSSDDAAGASGPAPAPTFGAPAAPTDAQFEEWKLLPDFDTRSKRRAYGRDHPCPFGWAGYGFDAVHGNSSDFNIFAMWFKRQNTGSFNFAAAAASAPAPAAPAPAPPVVAPAASVFAAATPAAGAAAEPEADAATDAETPAPSDCEPVDDSDDDVGPIQWNVGTCGVCGHTGPMDYGCSVCAEEAADVSSSDDAPEAEADAATDAETPAPSAGPTPSATFAPNPEPEPELGGNNSDSDGSAYCEVGDHSVPSSMMWDEDFGDCKECTSYEEYKECVLEHALMSDHMEAARRQQAVETLQRLLFKPLVRDLLARTKFNPRHPFGIRHQQCLYEDKVCDCVFEGCFRVAGAGAGGVGLSALTDAEKVPSSVYGHGPE